ncbi:MAG: hypothetical protein PUF13_08315 [Lachnospiraceae bacterium]|nr:hypothetical protein [Lachnospiraceae bacterium]
MLPLRASEEFPNRQNLEKILRGEHVREGGEAVRKLMIFLVFYSWWARKAKDSHTVLFCAEPKEREGCLSSINNYLSGAGYPEMYAGNPYDWIFLWALSDEQPLYAFRSYVMEIFAVHSEKMND